MSYFLCDCWYVSEKIINTFARRGFHTIGALKTNRLLYPSGMKKKLRELAAELSVTHREFVTARSLKVPEAKKSVLKAITPFPALIFLISPLSRKTISYFI